MARTNDPEKLAADNQRLREENRALRRAATLHRQRLRRLAARVEALQARQVEMLDRVQATDDRLRWLRARMLALERALES